MSERDVLSQEKKEMQNVRQKCSMSAIDKMCRKEI